MAAYDMPGFHPFGRPRLCEFGVDADVCGGVALEWAESRATDCDKIPMLFLTRLDNSKILGGIAFELSAFGVVTSTLFGEDEGDKTTAILEPWEGGCWTPSASWLLCTASRFQ